MLIIHNKEIVFLATNTLALATNFYIYLNSRVLKLYLKLLTRVYKFKYALFFNIMDFVNSDAAYAKKFIYRNALKRARLKKKNLNRDSSLTHNVKIQKYFLKYFNFIDKDLSVNLNNLVIKNFNFEKFSAKDCKTFSLYLNLFTVNRNVVAAPELTYSSKVAPYFKYKSFSLGNFIRGKHVSIIKRLTYIIKFSRKERRYGLRFFFNVKKFNVSKRPLRFINVGLGKIRRRQYRFFKFKPKYTPKFRRYRVKKLHSSVGFQNNGYFLRKRLVNFFKFFFFNLKVETTFTTTTKTGTVKYLKNLMYRSRQIHNKHVKKSRYRFYHFKSLKLKIQKFLIPYFYKINTICTKKKLLNSLKFLRYASLSSKSVKSSNIPLNKRVFPNNRVIPKFILSYYFKPSKSTQLSTLVKNYSNRKNVVNRKVIFLNVHRSLLKKLRETRLVHWNLSRTGKLNERRYKNLLKASLKNFKLKVELPNWLFVLFQLFNKLISWNHMQLILNFKLFRVNGRDTCITAPQLGDIVEVVVGLNTSFFTKWYFFNTRKYINRVKRWSYLNYCRHYNKLLKKKKKLPKVIKKLPIIFNTFKKSLYIDYSLGVVVVGKNLKNLKCVDEKKLYVSSVTKLYNWRYCA